MTHKLTHRWWLRCTYAFCLFAHRTTHHARPHSITPFDITFHVQSCCSMVCCTSEQKESSSGRWLEVDGSSSGENWIEITVRQCHSGENCKHIRWTGCEHTVGAILQLFVRGNWIAFKCAYTGWKKAFPCAGKLSVPKQLTLRNEFGGCSTKLWSYLEREKRKGTLICCLFLNIYVSNHLRFNNSIIVSNCSEISPSETWVPKHTLSHLITVQLTSNETN